MRIIVIVLAAFTTAAWTSSAIADSDPTESNCMVMAVQQGGGTVTVPLASLHVVAQTSKPGPFVLPDDAPANPTSLLCGRSSIIPAANDYKILKFGLTLGVATNDEKPQRVGVLEMVKGRLQFRMIDGVLTSGEMKELQVRLNVLQTALDAT